MTFANNGAQIISGGDDQTIRVWSKDGQLLQTLLGHVDSVHDIDVSSDEQTIASAGVDGGVQIWLSSTN